jgi:hypothetical protein
MLRVSVREHEATCLDLDELGTVHCHACEQNPLLKHEDASAHAHFQHNTAPGAPLGWCLRSAARFTARS